MAVTLRGLVYSKFKSIREFARTIGWDHNKATDIVNLEREPRVSELQEMAPILDVSVERLASFFTQKVTEL